MSTYGAFVTCAGQDAAWFMTRNREGFPADKGKQCGFCEASNVFLCDSCVAYWNECVANRLQCLWEFALELRKKKRSA